MFEKAAQRDGMWMTKPLILPRLLPSDLFRPKVPIKVLAEMKRAALLCSRIKLSTAQQNQEKKNLPFLLGQQSGYSNKNVDILCKPTARLFLSAIFCVDATV